MPPLPVIQSSCRIELDEPITLKPLKVIQNKTKRDLNLGVIWSTGKCFLLFYCTKNLQPIHFQGVWGGQIPEIRNHPAKQGRFPYLQGRNLPFRPRNGSAPTLHTSPEVWWFTTSFPPKFPSLRSIGKPRAFFEMLGLLFFEMMHPQKKSRIVWSFLYGCFTIING